MLRRIMASLVLAAALLQPAAEAADPVTAETAAPAARLRLLTSTGDLPSPEVVASGQADAEFRAFSLREARVSHRPFWVEVRAAAAFTPADATPVLVVEKGHHLGIRLFAIRDGQPSELPRSTSLPRFRGTEHAVFAVPGGLRSGERVLALVTQIAPRGSEELTFAWSTLDATLARADAHARMITLCFGALVAIALASLLLWFVLRERMLLYYSALIGLQALYIAYVSGFGFVWPGLSVARPLLSHAWNVPAAVAGGIACFFVRDIAQFRRYLPGLYGLFGWLGIAFLVVAVSNFIDPGMTVAYAGNALFVGTALLTIVAAAIAWRRGSRSAGWFLLAWLLLETFTMATAMHLLVSGGEDSDYLLYYGLPLSMVAASVLIALGLADRARQQRQALTDAERRAQTDPLTGVLNRRSVFEHLEEACARAQRRQMPISVLFIDLDHFKRINDSFGHPAGDACLRAVVAPIHAELRQSDVIGRVGGEEFVVVLSSAGEEAALPIAERIVQRVASLRVEGFGAPIHLTCSIGVAASDTLGVWGEALISRADAAVYAAKRSGRNRAELAPVDGSTSNAAA